MVKTTLPQGVRVLAKWRDKNTLRFDLPIQRASGQWNLLQKSLLIHSMLADYPIPPLYLVKRNEGDSNSIYQALDGKQRCTSIFEFIGGEYSLHASTPPVTIEGTKYELANTKFEELSDECKDLILGYRFTIYVLEDATDEEIEEVFARLNASTPLTLIQKSRTEMGTELAEWTRKVSQCNFLQHGISLTTAQARRESDLEILLQSMLLTDAKDSNYNYKAISMREVMKYCKEIRGNYADSRREEITSTLDYLSEAFTEKHKFLKKSNVPMVFIMGNLAMQKDIKPSDFKTFVDSFAGSECVDYEVNTGSGNIKRVKTEGRLVAMFKSFKDYFELPDEEGFTPIGSNKDAA
ncbi:DUF262 domain-containing protein [Mediterraneibacter glycyrrhizinilyticus]|uniref:DUF262 domain-containing protein n=1 Tax=Mediterraneibacter glycyrrhizinilyticus TaxID=342942 RepID=UPI00195F3B8E|nr:DUF262 domain-containing protein [Mediterraneibacter glycyrrhizinilyticus]MBM6750199.1 DUF262 domain-containing protein [Mediterraneibacter glycyrrhizinilyticus]